MAEKLEKPEQVNGQAEAGSEFYEAAQTKQAEAETRRFSTAAEREKNADELEEMLKPSANREQTAQEVHNEAGSPLKVEYKTDAERAEAVTKLMNSNASPFEMQGGLSEVLDDQDLPKAA